MVKVVFVHPDLGIGGAERLVVDAAVALKRRGHDVHIVTSHHDPGHCFPETRDGTLAVTISGAWLPRRLLGRFYALCAYLRMAWAALWLVFFSGMRPDVVICDQVSACVPLLRLRTFVIFYCHFPDQLLTGRETRLKALYRAPLDWLEQVTTGMADQVLVNSKFTAGVFRRTFSRLSIQPQVLYPAVDIESSTNCNPDVNLNLPFPQDSILFLSINRYERKKNIALALEALALTGKLAWLVIAGGYDERLPENVQHFAELVALAQRLGVAERVTFLRSPSNEHKAALLQACHVLLYTPSGEHFGIVPLEAMAAGRPVIAVNYGGPTETVVNGQTGLLCSSDPKDFAAAMRKLAADEDLRVRMGDAGKKRVCEKFSFEAFGEQLEEVVQSVVLAKDKTT